MEEQSRKIFDKALDIYDKEMNSKLANVYTRDVSMLKKRQKELEEELKELVQKELKNYVHVNTITDKLLVMAILSFVEEDKE
jgi:hypothetical protein